MKNIVLGILAHVDAGKTTLSEAILYSTGKLRNLGRVDNGDTLLDSDEIERKRGITVFSKQAEFQIDDTNYTILDTPGHVDFSAEMERCLQVLDYAILLIGASDGVKGHTKTLWRLLNQYNIPTIIFVNKMDIKDTSKENVLSDIHSELSDNCIDFSDITNDSDLINKCLSDEILEQIAMSDELVLESFLSQGSISDSDICELIRDRKIFPCFFGSALKMEGVDSFLQGLRLLCTPKKYGDEFGARVYKITRDTQGNRLTHIKVTGGTLKVKETIDGDEKVNQIRVYSGDKYEAIDTAYAGMVCAVLGLEKSFSGQGLGNQKNVNLPLLEPVLVYSLDSDDDINKREIYPKIKLLEEELPEIAVEWNDINEEILIKIMGPVQLEILSTVISSRFGFKPRFGEGQITYKETIATPAIGVGHFEPLRHYAEAHFYLEPLERGSGIVFDTDCSEDILDKNWQRLILTHLKEKNHVGVLTGSRITDMKITLINGKAHNKHTEGGDFRQATYRGVRQGLMQAESILLEPYYSFRLEIPADMLGRAMTDIDNMFGKMELPDIKGDIATITGCAPVSTIRDYQINLNSYTKGKGQLTCIFCGYNRCHNEEEVILSKGYNPDSDLENPTSSVFCAHGAGFIVEWYKVPEYMHLTDDRFKEKDCGNYEIKAINVPHKEAFDYSIGTDEIDEIISRSSSANQNVGKRDFKKKKIEEPLYKAYSGGSKKVQQKRPKLLLVDGYNVIFAWDETNNLAKENIDAAKDRLIQILSNYRGIIDNKIILVFDGYKVKGNSGSSEIREDIEVIHTKKDETADLFIEQYTNKYREEYDISVATSDGLIQQITRGHNCRVISSRELFRLIEDANKELRNNFNLK